MQVLSEMGVEYTITSNRDCLAITTFGDSPKAEMIGHLDEFPRTVALTMVYPVDVIIYVRAAFDGAFASEHDCFDFGAAVQDALRLWEEDRRWDRRTARLQHEEIMRRWDEEVAQRGA